MARFSPMSPLTQFVMLALLHSPFLVGMIGYWLTRRRAVPIAVAGILVAGYVALHPAPHSSADPGTRFGLVIIFGIFAALLAWAGAAFAKSISAAIARAGARTVLSWLAVGGLAQTSAVSAFVFLSAQRGMNLGAIAAAIIAGCIIICVAFLTARRMRGVGPSVGTACLSTYVAFLVAGLMGCAAPGADPQCGQGLGLGIVLAVPIAAVLALVGAWLGVLMARGAEARG